MKLQSVNDRYHPLVVLPKVNHNKRQTPYLDGDGCWKCCGEVLRGIVLIILFARWICAERQQGTPLMPESMWRCLD
ncbi:MAG: hypothetical protein PVJ39_17520, partial [Gammaproteobacteria bacterium]